MNHGRTNFILFRTLDFAAVFGLAGVYACAGSMKFHSPQAFADAIDAYELPLGGLVPLVALALPPLEFFCALGLFFRSTRRAALFILGSLTTFFLLLLLQAALRGMEIGCGCFGGASSGEYALPVAIARNLVLLLGVAWVWQRMKRIDIAKAIKVARGDVGKGDTLIAKDVKTGKVLWRKRYDSQKNLTEFQKGEVSYQFVKDETKKGFVIIKQISPNGTQQRSVPQPIFDSFIEKL